VRLPTRRTDDADVIRARLRALLADRAPPGWVPDEAGVDEEDERDPAGAASAASAEPAERADLPGLGRHRAEGPSVRLDPGRPGARALWGAALAAVALVVLWTWLQRPAAEPVPTGSAEPAAVSASPASSETVASPSVGEAGESSATVVVSVVGLVAEPGLVSLSSGSRVADAIEAAGGLLPDADPASVNLAAVVADGQQVAVGVPAATGTEPPPAAPGTGQGPVNLNTADVARLDGLPGIGPVLAQRIVDHRDQQGPFRDVHDLQDVAGIGPTILERLAGAVTV
jgi:competence protein ComEA